MSDEHVAVSAPPATDEYYPGYERDSAVVDFLRYTAWGFLVTGLGFLAYFLMAEEPNPLLGVGVAAAGIINCIVLLALAAITEGVMEIRINTDPTADDEEEDAS